MGARKPSRDKVVVSTRQATQPGGIGSLESILGLLKSLKIRAQNNPTYVPFDRSEQIRHVRETAQKHIFSRASGDWSFNKYRARRTKYLGQVDIVIGTCRHFLGPTWGEGRVGERKVWIRNSCHLVWHLSPNWGGESISFWVLTFLNLWWGASYPLNCGWGQRGFLPSPTLPVNGRRGRGYLLSFILLN